MKVKQTVKGYIFSRFNVSFVLYFVAMLVICAFKFLLFLTHTKNNCDNILLVFFFIPLRWQTTTFLCLDSISWWNFLFGFIPVLVVHISLFPTPLFLLASIEPMKLKSRTIPKVELWLKDYAKVFSSFKMPVFHSVWDRIKPFLGRFYINFSTKSMYTIRSTINNNLSRQTFRG